jgi:cytochrome P450
VSEIVFDPASPEHWSDPYPTYARLREEDPVHLREGPGLRCWWLTRYQDVAAVLRDPRFSARRVPSELSAPGAHERIRRLGELLSHMLLVHDPPDHTRLRGLVGKAFTPRVAERLRPRIESIVDGLLGAALARGTGRMDAIRDLATPLPVVVIAELLGVPTRDQMRFKRWSDDIAVVMDGTVRGAGLPRAAESAGELCEYLRAIFAARRRDPQGDLVSGLVAARDRGDSLSEEELVATCVLLLLAGHETTTNLIGNGLLALLRHPEQLGRLRREPRLAAAAVEEVLRYDPPVQSTSRRPHQDVHWRGQLFEAGVELDLILAAANRDPAVFADPERFDLGRADNRHLSFGHGAHFCLGAPLARLEAEVVFERAARRLPQLKLECEEPARRPGFVLRGLASLLVCF